MSESLIHDVKSDERGLVAAVVQDASTGEVIAVCHFDNQSLVKALETGRVEFLSSEVTGVGRNSGRLKDVRANLDGHSLTVLIEREPAADGEDVLAGMSLPSQNPKPPDVSLIDAGSMELGVAINSLYKLIGQRKEQRPEGSYTTYLFNSGLDKILKKIAEESGEVIIAAKNKSSREIVSEMADLLYHLLVLMVEREVKLADVRDELAQRSNIQRGKSE